MISQLGWTLVHFLWQGALVAAVLALALDLTAHASARVRYGLACVALGLLAVLPVVTFLALAPPVPVGIDVATASSGARWTVGEAIMASPSPLATLVGLWAVGVAILSVRLAGTLLHVARWRRLHTRPAGPEWQDRVDRLARRFGIARPIGVLLSDRLEVPSAWGVLRPIIVLPASLLMAMPLNQVETILLHELAHIRRHDYLVNLLQTVVETVLFYHPAVWWVSSIVRREREHCCDDAVVAALGDPVPYARALLQLEERRLTLPRPTLSAKESHLMNRIARLTGTQPASSRLSPVVRSFAAVAILSTLLGGALQAQAQPQSPKKPAPKPVAKSKPAKSAKPASPKLVVKERTRLVSVPKSVPLAFKVVTTDDILWAFPAPAPKAVPALWLRLKPAPPSKPAMAVPKVPPSPTTIDVAVQPARTPIPAQTGGGLGSGQGGGFGGGGGLGGSQGGGGFGGYTGGAKDATPEEELKITLDNGRVIMDLKDADFASAVRKLARQSYMSVVIEMGVYYDVTMIVSEKPGEEALKILCKAGKATYRFEDGVYYISSQVSGNH
ncbi:hypothetical protein BH11ARM2_BH11ARM2_34970 [soil metagenome]